MQEMLYFVLNVLTFLLLKSFIFPYWIKCTLQDELHISMFVYYEGRTESHEQQFFVK